MSAKLTKKLSTGSIPGLLKTALSPVRTRKPRTKKKVTNNALGVHNNSSDISNGETSTTIEKSSDAGSHFCYSTETPAVGSHRLPGSRQAQSDAIQNLMVRMEFTSEESFSSDDDEDSVCGGSEDNDVSDPVKNSLQAPHPGSHGIPGSRRAQEDAMESFMHRMEKQQQQQKGIPEVDDDNNNNNNNNNNNDDDDDREILHAPPPGSHGIPGSRRAQEDAMESFMHRMEKQQQEGTAEVDNDEKSVGSGHRYPGARRAQQQAFQNFLNASQDEESDSSDDDDEAAAADDASDEIGKNPKSLHKGAKQLTKKIVGEISFPNPTKLFPLAA